jgi:hypothetical protein
MLLHFQLALVSVLFAAGHTHCFKSELLLDFSKSCKAATMTWPHASTHTFYKGNTHLVLACCSHTILRSADSENQKSLQGYDLQIYNIMQASKFSQHLLFTDWQQLFQKQHLSTVGSWHLMLAASSSMFQLAFSKGWTMV